MTPESLLGSGSAMVDLGLAAKTLFSLVVLCSVRFFAAMLVLPATNDQVITGTVRNGLALILGLYVAWGQSLDLVQNLSTVQALVLIAKEAFIGMLLGFAMATVFWAAEGVGVLIDNQAGYNNVQQTNPMSGQQSTPVGNLLLQLAIAGFFMLGGLSVFAGLMFDSFGWWPVASTLPDGGQLLERFIPSQVRGYTEAVLQVAAPVILMLVLIDLGLGLLSRAAEKLEPSSLGQPIKGAVAVLMLVMLVAFFFDHVRPQLTLRPLAQQISKLLGTPR